ncbi:MAG TPA: DNA-directed RNA polymerase subunit omega [Clostridiaceae bacterium]
MINPSIVELLEKVENKYTLVTIASKRARQLINGEKPIVPTTVVKPVTIACNEINSGLLTYETVTEGTK